LTKWIIYFFSKKEFIFQFFNYIFSHHLLQYCDMSSEIIQNVASNNYNDFQHVNFIFFKIFISLFWGLFNNETNLRVRYWLKWMHSPFIKKNPPKDQTLSEWKFGHKLNSGNN
jgi:hypothetical protein